MPRCIIVDIDGTLADATHRLKHVTAGNRDWPAFFAAMCDDPPVEEIVRLVRILSREESIVLCSGRPDDYRAVTEAWLAENSVPYSALYMRPAGDTRKDSVVKAELLEAMRGDGWEPWVAVDDRPSIVALWRESGIVCLACRDWDEVTREPMCGLLTLMVGPSAAGKTTWLAEHGAEYGIHPSHVVSSDQIRADLCGDFRSQERNDEVFVALHAVVRARVRAGLPAVVDSTALRDRDRRAMLALTTGAVRYLVVDRPLDAKRRDAGWRADVMVKGEPLIDRHASVFASNLKAIMNGDGDPRVEVVDLRR